MVNKAPRSKTGHVQAGVHQGQRKGTEQCVPQSPTLSLALTEELCMWPDFSGPQPSLQNVGGIWSSYLLDTLSPLLLGRPHDQAWLVSQRPQSEVSQTRDWSGGSI